MRNLAVFLLAIGALAAIAARPAGANHDDESGWYVSADSDGYWRGGLWWHQGRSHQTPLWLEGHYYPREPDWHYYDQCQWRQDPWGRRYQDCRQVQRWRHDCNQYCRPPRRVIGSGYYPAPPSYRYRPPSYQNRCVLRQDQCGRWYRDCRPASTGYGYRPYQRPPGRVIGRGY